MQDDLNSLMDDMTAFIEGHGLRRFHGYVGEEVQTVLWDQNEAPDSWKDFVELAKGGGATFLSMHGGPLTRQEVDTLIERLTPTEAAHSMRLPLPIVTRRYRALLAELARAYHGLSSRRAARAASELLRLRRAS